MGYYAPGGGGLGPPVVLTSPTPTVTPLTIKGAPSQTAPLAVFEDNNNNVEVYVSAAGSVILNSAINAGILEWADTVNNHIWFIYQNPADPSLYVRDQSNGKMQMTLNPGPGTGGGSAVLNCGLQVQGNLGFYGAATAAKPAVTGAKGSNAALASLMAALTSLGLVTDSTTA